MTDFKPDQAVEVAGGHQGIVLETRGKAVMVQLGASGRRWYWASEVKAVAPCGHATPTAQPAYYDDGYVS